MVKKRILAATLAASLFFSLQPDRMRVIHYDKGGSIRERIVEMRGMDGVRIEGVCVSACTLYLGLPETCVEPKARLGFHGPANSTGGALPKTEWDQVSRIMAKYYPPPLRKWFMEKARFLRGKSVSYLSGEQVIKLGARRCE